jgi:mRNA (guanine-N7-)-methyltransferase
MSGEGSTNKRKLEADPFHPTSKQKKDGQAAIVAQHYNSRPEVGVDKRETSQIIQLKKFNNWIKAVLIQRFTRRNFVVLDFGCGKGGDMIKWSKANIKKLVGLGIAFVDL